MSRSHTKSITYYRVIRNAAVLGIVLVSLTMGGMFGGYYYLSRDLPSVARLELKDYTTGLITQILSKDGEVIKEYFEQKRIPIKLSQIPEVLIEATLAVEDQDFYSHWGVDLMGILRAAYVNIRSRRIVQGGSTITQQLARNLFLNPEKTLMRKIKEAILALEIESTYSKSEILELYFNQIYYGSGAYGAEAAAQVYFGKHVWELNLLECAVLAGIPRWPARYSPKLNPEASLERTKTVLRLMKERGYLTNDVTVDEIPLAASVSNEWEAVGPYFTEIVRQYLEDKYGYNRLYKGGLKVYTTMDMHLQKEAERILEEGLERIEGFWGYEHVTYAELIKEKAQKSGETTEYLQGALVALEPQTGFVRALIGGRDYSDNEFNRAILAKRQPGSVFKPIFYTAAIDNGIPASTIIIDSPVSIPQADGTIWRPTNYEKTFRGPTVLREALVYSINMISIKLLMKIGPQTATIYAKRMGIDSNLPAVESLALGSGEITPLEATVAFSTFPTGGIRVTPIFIERVEDSKGNVLEENIPVRDQVLSPQTAYVMTTILEDAIDYGTGKSARAWGFKRPAGGKTGTNTDYSDAWFIGFTPDLVCGVWVGFDENKTIIKRGSGARLALPIWTEFMKVAHENLPEKTFPMPEGITTRKICKTSGLLETEYCPRDQVYYEVFISGTEPTDPCVIHSPDLLQGDNEYFIDSPQDDSQNPEIF
ncbi:MAG: penicillin-binding protein 1A [Candidatus Glassbacteria bacterium]